VTSPGERHRQHVIEPLITGKRGKLAEEFRCIASDAGLLPEERGRVDGNGQAPGARPGGRGLTSQSSSPFSVTI
jgi:hypothetical protein